MKQTFIDGDDSKWTNEKWNRLGGHPALAEPAWRIRSANINHDKVDRGLKHEYLPHLHRAKRAMEIGRYGLSCHKLEDVIQFRQGIYVRVPCADKVWSHRL